MPRGREDGKLLVSRRGDWGWAAGQTRSEYHTTVRARQRTGTPVFGSRCPLRTRILGTVTPWADRFAGGVCARLVLGEEGPLARGGGEAWVG